MRTTGRPVRFKIGLVLVIGLVLLCGCATPSAQVNPEDEAEFMDDEAERRFGYYVDAQVTSQFLVLDNREIVDAVAAVGRKLAEVSQRPHLDYEFKVLNSSTINAFAGPGGFVYITTGLLNEMESKDELAAVIGHEIGHVAARHSVKALHNYQKARPAMFLTDLLAIAGAITIGMPPDLLRATGFMTTLMIFKGYSRAYEAQADRLGMTYAYKAGFDPAATIEIFEKFLRIKEEEGKKEQLTILSSHPALEDRIGEAEKFVEKLKRGESGDEESP